MKLNIVIIGLSITSSWGNGHATTYRSLIRALARRGHHITFLERNMPWYRNNRDLKVPDYCQVEIYNSLSELALEHAGLVRDADLVILGSYVPDGIAIGEWVSRNANGITAFYDIDTPVTLSGLETGQISYMSAGLIPRFDLYLSFTGGPALGIIKDFYGARLARALYCSADPDVHQPKAIQNAITLGYLGTYSDDRQHQVETMLLTPARQLHDHNFIVAGSKYPRPFVGPTMSRMWNTCHPPNIRIFIAHNVSR